MKINHCSAVVLISKIVFSLLLITAIFTHVSFAQDSSIPPEPTKKPIPTESFECLNSFRNRVLLTVDKVRISVTVTLPLGNSKIEPGTLADAIQKNGKKIYDANEKPKKLVAHKTDVVILDKIQKESIQFHIGKLIKSVGKTTAYKDILHCQKI